MKRIKYYFVLTCLIFAFPVKASAASSTVYFKYEPETLAQTLPIPNTDNEFIWSDILLALIILVSAIVIYHYNHHKY